MRRFGTRAHGATGGATGTAPLAGNSTGPPLQTTIVVPEGLAAIGLDGSTGESLVWIIRARTVR